LERITKNDWKRFIAVSETLTMTFGADCFMAASE
jgi:hypothetical protein